MHKITIVKQQVTLTAKVNSLPWVPTLIDRLAARGDWMEENETIMFDLLAAIKEQETST